MGASIAVSYHVNNVTQICDARERLFVLVHRPEMFGVCIIKSVLYVEPECTNRWRKTQKVAFDKFTTGMSAKNKRWTKIFTERSSQINFLLPVQSTSFVNEFLGVLFMRNIITREEILGSPCDETIDDSTTVQMATLLHGCI